MSKLSEETQSLVDELPSYYDDSETGGNWKLLEVVAEQSTDLDADVQKTDLETNVQEATLAGSLEEHASLVNLERYSGEARDHFRSRIIAEYQLNTSEGTVENMFSSIAAILGCKESDLWYQSWRHLYSDYHKKTVCFLLPYDAVQNIDLTGEEISEIINRLMTAGTTVKSQYNGSLRYITESEHKSGDIDVQTKGYDYLKNGSPTGDGGLKGGLIQ